MKIPQSVIMILLVLLLALLIGLLAQPAAAQGTVPPTPQPVNPIDKARSDANQWETIANQAVASAQAAIGQAYSAIASAEAGLVQAQMAAQQEHAARVAAEQGQIHQATDQAQAAQLSALKAIDLASAAIQSAQTSEQSAAHSERLTAYLRIQLMNREHQLEQRDQIIARLSGDNSSQAARLAQLEPYAQTMYREVVTAWIIAALLGFVLIAVLMSIVIIIAAERRNRWPRFKNGPKSALIVPVENH